MAKITFRFAAVAIGLFTGLANAADVRKATIGIDVGHPGAAISPMMYGLMTEEINHAYDGGLYAELIQNRVFKDNAKSPDHWSAIGGATLTLDHAGPLSAVQDVSLKIDSPANGGVANDGFWGIPIKPDSTYTASFYARGLGGFASNVIVGLSSSDTTIVSAMSPQLTDHWQKITVQLKAPTDAKADSAGRFFITTGAAGSFSINCVSLFPPTFANHPNGNRIDLMEKLAAMQPAFIRLPGGNYLEGDTIPTRFDWKKAIGPVDERPGHMGCWSYRSSDGFGLPEFLEWCDELHAEPLLAVYAGYSLQGDHVTGEALRPYIEDALEEIEYCTGDATTTWGKKRADDGHPAPFVIHYVEIGNEDNFDRARTYDERFTAFYDAIKAKYPELKLIATTRVHTRRPDLVDDHYYRSAKSMASDSGHYDKRDRAASNIFVGEWASQEGKPTPDLRAALGDTAWLMGLERDADVIPMTCYAPLFVNVNPGAWQWPTNLIGYDNLHSFGSPSYYAQVMINQNRADVVLPTTLNIAAADQGDVAMPHGQVGVGVWRTSSEYKEIVVDAPATGGEAKQLYKADLSAGTKDWTVAGGDWEATDGAIRPVKADQSTWAVVGDTAWTNYTIHLKARKISGREGFLVLAHASDSQNYVWWNVGGWNNTKSIFELTDEGAREQFGSDSQFTVETGKWYDLTLEVNGNHFKGYVDGNLVNEADLAQSNRLAFYSESSYARGSNEVVVKVVNMATVPVDAEISLAGASNVASTAKAWVLSGSPADVNTIQEPEKISPKEETVSDVSARFKHRFAPDSFTLMRIHAQP